MNESNYGARTNSRRRSGAITLTMLAGTAITLTACFDDDKPKHVANEAECVQQFDDTDGCRKAAAQAQQDFDKQAPRFQDRNECDAQFGAANCHVVREGDHDVFLPAMTGFLIGRMTAGDGQYRVQPTCANGGDLYSNGCGPIRSTAHPAYASGYNPAFYSYAGRYSGGRYEPSEAFTGSWTSDKGAASRVTSTAASEGVSRGGCGGSAVGEAGE